MRGYQKRVVFLKNTGSSLFEEAYFVIRSDKGEKSHPEGLKKNDFLEEANRIIEENSKYYGEDKRRRLDYKSALVFGLGFLSSSLIYVLYLTFI